MNRLHRLLRHAYITSGHGKRAFPPESLKAIQAVIARGETRHRAEVRLIIEPSLDWADAWSGVTGRQRARALFAEHRIWDTEENCGILVYVNLAGHTVDIVADRAAQRLLEKSDWQAVCRIMTAGYAKRQYHEATVAALEHLNDLLAPLFPAPAGDASANELSNRPLML